MAFYTDICVHSNVSEYDNKRQYWLHEMGKYIFVQGTYYLMLSMIYSSLYFASIEGVSHDCRVPHSNLPQVDENKF